MRKYTVELQEQQPIAGFVEPGMVPFCLVVDNDHDDDPAYVGFFGPPSLLEAPDTPAKQTRVCAWVAKVVFGTDRSDEYDEHADRAHQQLLAMEDSAERLPADVGGALCKVTVKPLSHPPHPAFEWVYTEDMDGLVSMAQADQKQHQLNEQLPSASSAPRPRM